MSKHAPKDYAKRRFSLLTEMLRDQREHTIKNASDRYGVTTRTIRNDIEILQKYLNEPNQKQYIVKGRGYYQGAFPTAVASIDRETQLYLFLALQHVKPLLADEGFNAFQILKSHLYSVLSKEENERIDFWDQYYYINSFGNLKNQDHFYQSLNHVFEAIRFNQIIKFFFKRDSLVYFDPFCIYFSKKAFYIVGDKIPSPAEQSSEYRKRRMYRLDRLSHLERLPNFVSKLGSNKTETQDFKRYQSKYHIKHMIEAESSQKKAEDYVFIIRDVKALNRIVEREWHPEQEITIGNDGLTQLLIPEVKSPVELQKWALGWGAAIEVKEPLFFRKMVQQEISKMYHHLYQ
ncbi:transcriptional regulator [Hazenella sp. IB182353]|uniref:helix-turn-helix transcriptional regulator n=1 Tax=Polycladospora coralii TaxID=2771432 RepID=UPI0017463D93|nr:transcriptional regulator [Polycladospora coralii]MBS7531166.1 transcriptional regulator [Polycladospora coralii]